MSTRLDARSLIDLVLDDASFTSWDTTPVDPPVMTDTYRAELAAAGKHADGHRRLANRGAVGVAGE